MSQDDTARRHSAVVVDVLAAMRHVRQLQWLAAALAVSMALGACSYLPGASLSPRELAIRQLAANRALWEAKGPKGYAITVERQCFCPSAQYQIVVDDGIVMKVTRDGAPVRPAEVAGLPKTVPELFAVVAALSAGADVEVNYDAELGYPTMIQVDPIPNAIDDEYTIVVHAFQFL